MEALLLFSQSRSSSSATTASFSRLQKVLKSPYQLHSLRGVGVAMIGFPREGGEL